MTQADMFEVRPEIGDVKAFYAELFKPVETALGPMDEDTLMAIVGFQAGGPVSLCTVGREKQPFATYVSCELACYRGQQPSTDGPFELLITCNDEGWARRVLTSLGQLSFDAVLGHGHTIDLGKSEEEEGGGTLEGVVLERFSASEFRGHPYCILRVIGVTRPEMEWAQAHSVEELVQRLKGAGVYPNTDPERASLNL
jgi:hypothetical protein